MTGDAAANRIQHLSLGNLEVREGDTNPMCNKWHHVEQGKGLWQHRGGTPDKDLKGREDFPEEVRAVRS